MTTPPGSSALGGDGDGATAVESRPLSAFEDMFARSAPHLGMTCQWFRLSCAENNSPCSPDDIVAALHRVHRRIVPLRCVLEKMPDGTMALAVREGLKPDIPSSTTTMARTLTQMTTAFIFSWNSWPPKRCRRASGRRPIATTTGRCGGRGCCPSKGGLS